jgi:hypothetical protein
MAAPFRDELVFSIRDAGMSRWSASPTNRVEIGVRQLLRLDQVMQIRRRVVPHRLEMVRLEDAQHLERGDPLVVRRQLPQRDSP